MKNHNDTAVPVIRTERFESLDVLRGFALLGILVINIQLFAMPEAAYSNPSVWGDLSGINYLVWLLSHVLADQKMMTIFSMLFGAGIVLFIERAEQRTDGAVGLHLRRSFWLLLFGVLHAYLLWYGDILVLYGLCAFVVVWFRRWRPVTLILVGTAFLAVSTCIYLYAGWSMPYWPEEVRTAFLAETWQPERDSTAAEIDAYRGGWLDQMAHRVPAALAMQTFVFLIWGFWRAAGLMLIGMALYKLGVFSAQRAPAFYTGLIVVGLLLGVPLVGYGVHWNFANDWGPLSLFYGSQFNYWASVPVSLAWVALVMLACQRQLLPRLLARLAAVGRTAFSNYILQTLICTGIFYGHGLGLFADVSRIGQIGIVLAVWIVQLLVSPLWLRHFRFGPLEWLWRCLTYWQWLGMRTTAPAGKLA
ncbi:MAG: DUF418 domain-containing protein [Gammaproteobacteria bacterium]|nr:MAG: DUF418 domain-containing protein [Gammaproteobacteria bacterium]